MQLVKATTAATDSDSDSDLVTGTAADTVWVTDFVVYARRYDFLDVQ
jgi:hypothetical protein